MNPTTKTFILAIFPALWWITAKSVYANESGPCHAKKAMHHRQAIVISKRHQSRAGSKDDVA